MCVESEPSHMHLTQPSVLQRTPNIKDVDAMVVAGLVLEHWFLPTTDGRAHQDTQGLLPQAMR